MGKQNDESFLIVSKELKDKVKKMAKSKGYTIQGYVTNVLTEALKPVKAVK